MKKIFQKTDFQVLKEHHKFIRPEEEDIDPRLNTEKDYGNMIAKKYYNKLYREYAIIDLQQYKTGQIGMRWRTKDEVLSGRGETTCSNKKCEKDVNLSTWEVNFKYKEDDSYKQTLVKAKCCEGCAEKLNFKKKHNQVKDKEFSEQDILRMLKKLEARKDKVKKEEDEND